MTTNLNLSNTFHFKTTKSNIIYIVVAFNWCTKQNWCVKKPKKTLPRICTRHVGCNKRKTFGLECEQVDRYGEQSQYRVET